MLDPRVEPAEKQTSMAAFRTKLALDRTTLAWIRTAIAMASFGFGMVAFFRTLMLDAKTPEAVRLHQGAIRYGAALVVLGICTTVFSAMMHILSVRQLHQGRMAALRRWPLSAVYALLLAGLGATGLMVSPRVVDIRRHERLSTDGRRVHRS